MTRNKSPGTKLRSPSSASAGQSDRQSGESSSAAGGPHHFPSPAAIRELVESVVIAFVLAFLFRTFEAEAFVIPTGSMAPTLMGRHKDVICPKCKYPYQVSASEEVTPDGAMKGRECQVEFGTCPMCRYTNTELLEKKEPSYNGDRILVSKFAYQIGEPQRWDVIVFKYPGDSPNAPPDERSDSRINYIKRLVGLPGDTIRIQNGDVWVKSAEDKKKLCAAAEFVIARRPPRKLLAMLQPVFDNDYMPLIAKYGWPARWYSASDSPAEGRAAGAWRTEEAAFSIDGTAKGPRWLRYHHQVPSFEQWQKAASEATPAPSEQLITDFTAYDTGRMRKDGVGVDPDGVGQHWVGDLAVECTADVQSDDGAITLELRKGGRQFQCQFDLKKGDATLSIVDKGWQRTAQTSVKGKGRHKILFSNCDDELRLWVDGELVSFRPDTTYQDLGNTWPDKDDLTPVGIASTGAGVRISRLRVLRDIYYIADIATEPWVDTRQYHGWTIVRHDACYPTNRAPPETASEPRQLLRYVEFSLKADQFFVLGDNSAKSKDGRLWGPEQYWVPRDLLIGKAMFIYWPHSWDRLPYFNSIPCPYFPNFSRMGLVR